MLRECFQKKFPLRRNQPCRRYDVNVYNTHSFLDEIRLLLKRSPFLNTPIQSKIPMLNQVRHDAQKKRPPYKRGRFIFFT